MKAKTACLLLLVLQCITAIGQRSADRPDYVRMLKDTSVHNFLDIKESFNDYFAARPKGRGTGYVQFQRLQYQVESSYGPSGKMFNVAAKNMEEYQNYVEKFNPATLPVNYDPGYWQSLGPTNYLNACWGGTGGVGRVNCIAFHPTDPNIQFVGTPAGGLWKHAGAWVPLTDGFPSIGVSGIAIEPDNPDHIYILTGDGDAGHSNSIGVLETFNGGITWQKTGLTWGAYQEIRGFKLIMSPANHDMLYVATSAGIWMTVNHGVTWAPKQAGWFMDIEFKPGAPLTMYAATATTFFKSVDAGLTWNSLATGLPAGGSLRIGIGVTPANPELVYLMYGQSSNDSTRSGFMGFYVSGNSGVSFSPQSDSPNIFGYEPDGNDWREQADYDLAMTVCPSAPALIQFGGINCWRSEDMGVSWDHTSFWQQAVTDDQYTHADIHALEYNPLNNYLYCGSDGGVFISVDNGDTWVDVSLGLVITQAHRMGGFAYDQNFFATGTQDNGTNLFNGPEKLLVHDQAGDGFECMVPPGTGGTIRYESTHSTLYVTIDNGASWFTMTPHQVPWHGLWDVAWTWDYRTTDNMYLGQYEILYTTDAGTSWDRVPGLFNNTGEKFRHIVQGIDYYDRFYALTKKGIFTVDGLYNSWSNITSGLPVDSCDLSCVTVESGNSHHVFVTCYGYKAGMKVYKSTNTGATWTNISGTLPNIPVNCIAFEPGSTNHALYIGTDNGVFYRNDDIGDWVPFFNGLPNTRVTELELSLYPAVGEICAATFGRGFWKSKLYGHCPTSFSLTPANNPSTSSTQYYGASDHISSTRQIYESYNTTVTYKAGNFVVLNDGFEAKTGSTFSALIGPCSESKAGFTWSIKNRTSGYLETKRNAE
jgi:photosystem II stability/assembly factor-like uncharacterized protein